MVMVVMVAVYFSDKYYYYNDKNVRYTIGRYNGKLYLIGRNAEMTYDFSYRVGPVEYTASTRIDFSSYQQDKLRVLIKYSAINPEFSKVVKVVIPSWVLSPPKDGWKEYPPDINWEGAVLDTLYMQKLREERKE
jgi:hypothetical protein